MARLVLDEDELQYQIHTHLLYELKWMIFAASEFENCDGCPHVALIDSAAVHARNLLEFARLSGEHSFNMGSLGGAPSANDEWEQFINNRLLHMHYRESLRLPWPDGLDNDRPDRLLAMARVVIDLLEANGRSIPAGPVRQSFDAVLSAAGAYQSSPSEGTHAALADLFDDSRESDDYAGPRKSKIGSGQ